jgi:PAS domain S-box-containing protein
MVGCHIPDASSLVNLLMRIYMTIRTWTDLSQKKQIVIGSAILALCYYLSAKVGLILSVKPDYISVLWIPNAVLLTALLVSPYHYWIYFLLAIIPAELAADLPEGISFYMSVGFIIADWIEVLIAAFLVRKLTKNEFKFYKLNHLIIFICAAVLIGPFYAAFPGALINFWLASSGPGFWSRWLTWFMSDALTHLTVTSTIFVWLKYRYVGEKLRHPVFFYTELSILITMLIFSVHISLVEVIDILSYSPARYLLPMPFLLWAAVRFGPRTIFSAAFFITIITVWNTSSGVGLFTVSDPAIDVFNLQSYLMISLMPFMFLSILMVEQKRTKDQIKYSEKQFRDLADFLPQTIFEVDPEGKFLFVNQSALEKFKYTNDDFKSGKFKALDMIAPQDRERAAKNISRVLSGEDMGLKEYVAICKDGTTFPSLIRSSLIVEEGEITGIRGFLIDISEFKNMEEYIRESEARFNQVVQFSPVGIFELDLEQRKFISVNDVMCNYTGYTEKELLSMDPAELLTESSREALERLYQNILAGIKTTAPVEYKIRNRTNDELWVLVNYKIHYVNEQPKKASALVSDITAIRKAEEDKQILETQLVQAQKMESLGTLAGGIAHDFNNLLTGIHGNVSLIKLETDPNFKHFEKLNNIETYVQRAVDLTKQLLGLAKGGKYEVKPTNINELLLSSSEIFSRTHKQLSVQRDLEDNIWTVEIDQSQIEMVLLNLYLNAWQAMGGSGDLFLKTENMVITKEYASKYNTQPDRYVKISVRDTGTGIDQATQKRIFDPFFTTKEKERGTGLGLASAYGIIKNHEGIINVYSEPGKGSVFNIFLPASEKEPKHRIIAKKEIKMGKETILIVDDEKMIIEVGREMLTAMGYIVITAEDGEKALDIVKSGKHEIDLVILDMIMPRLSGSETFTQLRNIDPELKIILSSGYSIDGEASDIMNKGCNGFVQKPFGMDILSNKIREVLDEQ